MYITEKREREREREREKTKKSKIARDSLRSDGQCFK